MSIESREDMSASELTLEEKEYFSDSDVDAVLEEVGNPEIITKMDIVKYAYNKATVAGMQADVLDRISSAVAVDNKMRARETETVLKDQNISALNGQVGLTRVAIFPRANSKRVNLDELDLDAATWARYELESEQYVDADRSDDDAYKDNLTLAYARGQEFVTYLQELGYQGTIDVAAPIVVEQDSLDDEKFTEAPGFTVRTEYRVVSSTVSKEIDDGEAGLSTVVFDENTMKILSYNDAGKPSAVQINGQRFAVYGYERKASLPYIKRKTRVEKNGIRSLSAEPVKQRMQF